MHPTTDNGEIPRPYHRWRINEDPYFNSGTSGSYRGPDYCLACGIVRHSLGIAATKVAEAACTGSSAGAAEALQKVHRGEAL